MFDEQYVSGHGYTIDPEVKIPVLIDIAIIIERMQYAEGRVQATVAMGNTDISVHYGDTKDDVVAAAIRWVRKNFRVPDSVTFNTKLSDYVKDV
jgi:acid phosphatase class B